LAHINVDEEYNNHVLREDMKRFNDMEECLILRGDPNPEIIPSWLNCCFLSFFDKVNGGKIVLPMPITCWGDGSTMFERLHHKDDSQAKIVKWEFEVEEGWLPYRSLSSHLIASEKEFVHPGEMAKWMESGCWCQVCFDPLGPEGAFQQGSCGHVFQRCLS
jgi:hypothetical protein